ncbi:MAG: hypothetical protein IJ545_03915 [Alphaproteobacteria bacterium]|nr:hypothetical protein [Alphaproteobacteria bacterium]
MIYLKDYNNVLSGQLICCFTFKRIPASSAGMTEENCAGMTDNYLYCGFYIFP